MLVQYVLVHFDGRLRGIEVFTLVTPWNITVFIWGGSRGEEFREFEPLKLKKRDYKMLIWPQNVRNTISEGLNFKHFPGEDAPYPYRRGCLLPLQERMSLTPYRKGCPYHLQKTTSSKILYPPQCTSHTHADTLIK